RDGQTIARVALDPIPDLVPLVTVTKPPQHGQRGALTLFYKFEDDYGIASAEAQFKPLVGGQVDAGAQPLVDPPQVQLALPGEPGGVGEGQTSADLASHPWAGAKVQMVITAKDEAGQDGASDPIEVTLPQRPFGHPLAKALTEQRRTLVLDARKRSRVLRSLEALMINPERYTPQPGVWLGLKTAHNRLRAARSKESMLEVAEYLWGMAVFLEDGDLSQAERDLRAAQEALRQALERGASDEEIKKLMQDLRAALDKYMQQLAEQMRRDGRDPQEARPLGPNDRVITQRDLQRMLDRMEQMAREGSRDEARRMLDEMQRMLENLQQARPQRGRQQNQQAREMNRALEDLDRMIRDQQRLRDETFQQGQNGEQQSQRRDRMRQGQQQRNQAQRGQQGQRQQGQRQQGQRGQQGQGEQEQAENEGQEGEGQDGQQAEGQEGQQGQQGRGRQGRGQSLAERQEQLRQRLENLRNRMRGMGQNGEQMGEAEDAMREAERGLQQGQDGQAADAQGRALEALRRGAQQMAQQMMDGMGEPNGDQADGTDNGRDPNNPDDRRRAGTDDADPLGRPPPTRDAPDTSRYRVPQAGESAAQRAQRVLEELRRRLSDPSRPTEELDYLRRLLRPY
ncbi:MAG: TIGR02302 family protein, partial [Beijerinckiaceae bacterium]